MQRISSLPPLFTLFRHSSRNQRYKHAGLLAYSKGRRISWRDLIHSRARFRGIAGAKTIPEEDAAAPFFSTLSKSIPCLPTASTPSFFEEEEYLNERNLERRKEKRNNKLQQVDGGRGIERRGMVERNEANEVEGRRPFAEKLRAKWREGEGVGRDEMEMGGYDER